MSLFPTEDILTKEIESWRSFAASLNSEEYREIFNKMLSECYKNKKTTKDSITTEVKDKQFAYLVGVIIIFPIFST